MTLKYATSGIAKKLINDPFDVVDEMLEGFVWAHSNIVEAVGSRVVARRVEPGGARTPKVGVVVGGGSGHEPAFAGYVGAGMADAAACGNVFASPPPDDILTAIRVANMGQGVVLTYGNYAGDVLNFDKAAELAAAEGIETLTVRVSDDVASAKGSERAKRRGIAGDFFVFKAIGASAERGDSLDAVARIGDRANRATRSMGVALGPCWVPGTGRPSFELGVDEMEIGLGLHGEPGVRRGPLASADDVARMVVEAICDDMTEGRGSGPTEIALLINGLGATAVMDQYVFYRGARRAFEAAGFEVSRSFVGEYLTSLEMCGASISAMLVDEELRALLDAPAACAALVQ